VFFISPTPKAERQKKRQREKKKKEKRKKKRKRKKKKEKNKKNTITHIHLDNFIQIRTRGLQDVRSILYHYMRLLCHTARNEFILFVCG
jgi:ribosomal protein S25